MYTSKNPDFITDNPFARYSEDAFTKGAFESVDRSKRAKASTVFGARASCPHRSHDLTVFQNAMGHVNLRAGCPRSQKKQ